MALHSKCVCVCVKVGDRGMKACMDKKSEAKDDP